MKLEKKQLLAYLVTDRSWLAEKSLGEQVEEALKGGVTFVQLREKNKEVSFIIEEAKKIKEITKKYKVPFVINDNVEIALATEADGVHLGQGDGSPFEARAKLGENKIIGVSVQTVEQARLAESQGADYLGVGDVFGTATKKDAKPVALEEVRRICQEVSIPVVAIGGIKQENMKELKGCGLAGVAVISAILGHPQVEQGAKEILEMAMEIAK